MKEIFVLVFASLLLFSCKSTQPLVEQTDQNTALRKRALWHVQCLNQFNLAELSNIYAADFAGLAPIVEFTDKETLLQSLDKNYRNSATKIVAKVISSKARAGMGYVLLNWKVVSAAESTEVVFEKQLLEIWETNKKGEWTLTKMLFYHPDEGFGINN